MKRTARRRNPTDGPPPAEKGADRLLLDARAHRNHLAALTDDLARQRARSLEQQSWLAIANGETAAVRRRLEQMYEFVPVPYLMVSDLGVIVKVNQRGVDLLATERRWLIGRPLVAYVEPKDLRTLLDVYRRSTGQAMTVEVDLRSKHGPKRVQLVVRAEPAEYGDASVFHVAIVDLTPIREMEERRREAERRRLQSEEAERVALAANEAKDQFLAMLSHELRTPLTPILAAADSLTSHDSLPSEVVGKLEIIRRNVRAEARLIDDLLDVARITRRSFDVVRRPIDLHEVLEHVVEAWRETFARERLPVDVRMEAARHWVDGDGERLGQVLRNLVSNAVKFSERGGRISVRTEEHEGRLRVTVADQGAGMTEKQLEMLFKPFVRAEDASARRGLGLGLVISRAIVEAHGGTLHVWSRGKNFGTTVRVELDAIAEPARKPVADAPAAIEKATAKVLLVEDDRDSAEMLGLLLSSEGFEVRIARSLREARALVDCCDVVVSDIALPDGSGLDLMRGFRAEGPMRAIALSGYGSSQDVQRSLDAGFEAHLTKPVDLGELVAAVRRLATQKA